MTSSADACLCLLAAQGRNEAGLTTLEWLLVVAAVAGLAAVAVVLVQYVVGGTAEQVESHSARQEAAELAALTLKERWQAETPTSSSHADDINGAYEPRCRQLGILYADIDLDIDVKGGKFDSVGGSGWSGPPKCEFA